MFFFQLEARQLNLNLRAEKKNIFKYSIVLYNHVHNIKLILIYFRFRFEALKYCLIS